MGRQRSISMLGVLLVAFILVSTPTYASARVNMEFKDAPLVDVFQILGEIGGLNVLVDRSVDGNVSFILKDLSVNEALELVSKTTGYQYKVVGNTLVVATPERLRAGFSTEDFAFVAVDNVDANSARALLNLVVPNVRAYVDSERQLLVLYGTSQDLELAARVVKEYDKPAFVPVETQLETDSSDTIPLKTQVLAVRYGNGSRILGSILESYPDRSFRWENESKRIIGQATDAEWEVIRELVFQLDMPEFQVRGIMETQDRSLALVEYEGRTVSLEEGESLDGWIVTKIMDRTVEFAQGERSFSVVMGR